jgi:hypothetical protein
MSIFAMACWDSTPSGRDASDCAIACKWRLGLQGCCATADRQSSREDHADGT